MKFTTHFCLKNNKIKNNNFRIFWNKEIKKKHTQTSMEDKNDSDVFNQKLLLQEDKYVDFKPLKIYCGTFNVKLNATV